MARAPLRAAGTSWDSDMIPREGRDGGLELGHIKFGNPLLVLLSL